MLIGIPSILGPDLLYTLRSMGHGDEIALVDGNYPAQEHGRRVVRADGSLAQGERQQALLEAEGVPILRGRVVMDEARFGEL